MYFCRMTTCAPNARKGEGSLLHHPRAHSRWRAQSPTMARAR
jgi:hypothetical protein